MILLAVFYWLFSSYVAAEDNPTMDFIDRGSDSKCTPCITSQQCKDAYGDRWHCCPFMKKCISSGSMSCPAPIARCSPRCWDESWPISCSNGCVEEFPNNWITALKPVEIPGSPSKAEMDAFNLVNKLREDGAACGGLDYGPNMSPQLKFDCRLWRAAKFHTNDMAKENFVGKEGSNGWDYKVRAKFYRVTARGEIVSKGMATAQAVVNHWQEANQMDCINMMNQDRRAAGVAYNENGNYWTIMFAWDDVLGSLDESCFGEDVTPAPTNSPEPTIAPTPPPTKAPTFPMGLLTPGEVWGFNLINELRKKGFTCPDGKKYEPNNTPLEFDCRLWKASQLHSEDMAKQNYFSHTSKDGRKPSARAQAQGFDKYGGENIAGGWDFDAKGAMEGWKKSNGHCENMMNPAFKTFGVGHVYKADSNLKHYWTQMFGGTPDVVEKSCLGEDKPRECGVSGKLKKKGKSLKIDRRSRPEKVCDCEDLCFGDKGGKAYVWKKKKCSCYEGAKSISTKTKKKKKKVILVGMKEE